MNEFIVVVIAIVVIIVVYILVSSNRQVRIFSEASKCKASEIRELTHFVEKLPAMEKPLVNMIKSFIIAIINVFKESNDNE